MCAQQGLDVMSAVSLLHWDVPLLICHLSRFVTEIGRSPDGTLLNWIHLWVLWAIVGFGKVPEISVPSCLSICFNLLVISILKLLFPISMHLKDRFNFRGLNMRRQPVGVNKLPFPATWAREKLLKICHQGRITSSWSAKGGSLKAGRSNVSPGKKNYRFIGNWGRKSNSSQG